MADMMWFLEHLFPGFVQGLYANGVARESLARALNGTAETGTILALSAHFSVANFKTFFTALIGRITEVLS